MKITFTLILSILSLIFNGLSQNPPISNPPIPIPLELNLQQVNGSWYVIMVYDYYAYPEYKNITCWTMNINASQNSFVATEAIYYFQNPNTVSSTYTLVNDSIWEDSTGDEWVWLDLDPLTYSYSIFAQKDEQTVFFLARTQTVSKNLYAQMMTRVLAQNYYLNISNIVALTQPCYS